MGLGGVISNILSLGAQLLPVLSASTQDPSYSSYSSSPLVENNQLETELKKLTELWARIKATLSAADGREIRDDSAKLWLKELERLAYDAEDVLDEYHYHFLEAQVEARDASPLNCHKMKLIQVPYGMLNQIQQIRSKFAELEIDRIALRLLEEDGPRNCNSDLQIAPTSHLVVESDIIGREREKEELIDLLSSESQDDKIISVVTIVGTGGIGKTTLAQLVFNDQRIRQKFDKLGWICISEDFNVQRLTREVIESITGESCCLANLCALQEKISKEIRGERVFLVLDDVWNENRSHWELFRRPFMSASLVKILVTTRNEHVARIMQTMPTFNLGYLLEEQSWKMFQHHAFGDVTQNMDSKLVKIGKQIMKKCGMLPLAVKSIASLLRHETNEESWKEILESELWESDAGNEIFPSLQISYARLPTYLKPCFLYCSMFPRDYHYSAKELVKLWISQGYVQNNGLKNTEKIGWEYAKQLWQRSFFEGKYRKKEFYFTLHDMVHDLARYNSGHGCYSVEGDMIPNFPKELYHLYVGHRVKLVEPPHSGKFATLRTLIVGDCAELFLSAFDFSKAQKLRALQLGSRKYDLEFHYSFVNLKHLRYLFLSDGCFARLHGCICSLYNLQYLTLDNCPYLTELPKSIGNLIGLEELIIRGCKDLRVLPVSLCRLIALRKFDLWACSKLEELPHDMGKLMNLQLLRICFTNVSFLPPSLNKIMRTPALKLNVRLLCSTIGWLGDFVDLEGTLSLIGLSCVHSLKDVLRANLARMHNLKRLILTWIHDRSDINVHLDGSVLELYIVGNGGVNFEIDSDEEEDSEIDFSLMVRLQAHPNLKELNIQNYRGSKFPAWIGNPTLCTSLESIELFECNFVTFLPFGSLYNLKYLKIWWCSSLQFIQAESLPLLLEEIDIFDCKRLKSVMGLQRLKSLVKLDITDCRKLHLLDHCWTTCIITVDSCPKLREWCSQHEIFYKGTESDSDEDC
ncbi:hypothetical protein LUZ61_001000 [Rhynchospora tenuis]|uniref:Uncharacterized protein n=1 Tax=Rhynchospora tenuis TaxID=198213 RepID=A0AAD5ZG66_9POAL|nr:hypothetical protein LUZ61_001000 [Rhynchospora tenuis]